MRLPEKWKAHYPQGIKRVEAVDLFKFFVLFLMIQGHLFRDYLLPALRAQHWLVIHEIFHGVVAPGFLFSAGFAAFLSYHNKKEKATQLNRAFFQRLRRILFIVLVGYWIHLPSGSLRVTLSQMRGVEVPELIRVNILQCIGIGLLLFSILALLLKKEKFIIPASLLLTLAFFLLPEQAKQIRLHPLIDTYFSHELSVFPLFPWAGFLFSGILAAFLYSRLRRDIFFRLLLVLGALMFPWFFFYKSQTVFKAELTLSGNLNKFGGVFLLLWFCDWLIRHCQGKLVELMKRAAKESLFVYVFHMFAIFGCIFSPGLEPFFKDTLTIIPALGLFLVLQLFVFGVSLIYEYLKDKKPKIWRWAFNLFWAGFLLVFVLRPC